MHAVVTVAELVQLHARNNTILLTVFGFVGSKRLRIKWSGSRNPVIIAKNRRALLSVP